MTNTETVTEADPKPATEAEIVLAITDEDREAANRWKEFLNDRRLKELAYDFSLHRRAALSSLSSRISPAAESTSTATPAGETRRFRHKQRGTTYRMIGLGKAQGSVLDEDSIVIYVGENGDLWARPEAEFFDGRFEELASLTAAPDGETR